ECLHKYLHLEAVGIRRASGRSETRLGGDLLVPLLGAVASLDFGGEEEGGGYLCRLVTARVGEESRAVTVPSVGRGTSGARLRHAISAKDPTAAEG
uniref:Uncharacterized protein n=1 Tax=Aegilops tauschii subsp. strangulata TaxID=200361 RepID=A0A453NEX1_AEGTS